MKSLLQVRARGVRLAVADSDHVVDMLAVRSVMHDPHTAIRSYTQLITIELARLFQAKCSAAGRASPLEHLFPASSHREHPDRNP